jgi:hypothetical protein
MDADKLRFVMQVFLSAIVLAVGFGVLLSGIGQKSDAELAACGVGVILGFWMREGSR